MTLLGYARVSTLHQSPDMQTRALTEAGAERIWTDRMSGARDDRPELAALLDYARRGDVLMVWRLDRLGRSLPHLLTIASDLQDRGIELRSLTEAIDTTTPGGPAHLPRLRGGRRVRTCHCRRTHRGRSGSSTRRLAAIPAAPVWPPTPSLPSRRLIRPGLPVPRSPAPSESPDPAFTAASLAPVSPRRATHRASSTDSSICRSPTRSTIRCPRRR